MHTFTGKYTTIHYSSDLSGDVRIQDKRTEGILEPYGQDIIDFANEQWNNKLIKALEEPYGHGQWIPDPGDARHKEIMDMLKEIRDTATTQPCSECGCVGSHHLGCGS